jgi:UDP-N-acetylmuramyl pentapeptide phosphotransferase/UDP-N-acetylglucosamine-1-phosphate transferase
MIFSNINIFYLILLILFGALSSYLLNRYVYFVFSKNNIVDQIKSRSSHTVKATRSGGLSVFLSICLCLAITGSFFEIQLEPWGYLSVFFMALIGLADDFYNIRYREKFFLQLFAGFILLQTGYLIDSFHGIFGVFGLPTWLSGAITLFVFLIVVNALNLIDGLDGLASLISIKFLVIVGGVIMISESEIHPFFPITIGSLFGFLLHNFNSTKKVFLGDTGSLFIGTTMAFFIIYILDSSNQIVTDTYISRPLFCVLVLIYPLTDTLRAVILRAYRKKSPFVADRIHLHHRLADKGYEHWAASLIVFVLSAVLLGFNLLLFSYFGLLFCVILTLLLMLLFYYFIFR